VKAGEARSVFHTYVETKDGKRERLDLMCIGDPAPHKPGIAASKRRKKCDERTTISEL
jgi:hypothetical protein